MDLRFMAMEQYTSFPRAPKLESRHQLNLSVIPKTSLLVLLRDRGYSHHTLSPTDGAVYSISL